MATTTVAIPQTLHQRIRRECKQKRPRTNIGDRAAELIEKGYQFENGQAVSCPESIMQDHANEEA